MFVFNIGGIFIVFKYQQYHVRKEIKKQIKQGVPEDELTVIIKTAENSDQFVWVKPGKEFRYKGTMFDIVRQTTGNNGDITYHCINDTQETTLFVNLDKQVKKNMDARNNGNDPVNNLFQSLYFSPEPQQTIFASQGKIREEFHHYYFSLSSALLKVSGPPPKIV